MKTTILVTARRCIPLGTVWAAKDLPSLIQLDTTRVITKVSQRQGLMERLVKDPDRIRVAEQVNSALWIIKAAPCTRLAFGSLDRVWKRDLSSLGSSPKRYRKYACVERIIV